MQCLLTCVKFIPNYNSQNIIIFTHNYPIIIHNYTHKYPITSFQLWYSFFQLCVGFITQRSLQLEEFRESKKKKIAVQYGDMRSEMGQEMVRMFNSLGECVMGELEAG